MTKKMKAGDVFRSCMISLDVRTARRCWQDIAPNMHCPDNDFEILVTLHYARTITKTISDKLRVYSHDWLLDRELPSGLPDDLKSKSQRIYPKVVEAVGVSVKALSVVSLPLAKAIERAMSNAVAECYADGMRDPVVIRAKMEEARLRIMAS